MNTPTFGKPSIEQPTLADWLAQEPFTLTMSSGFFSFYAHCGMLCALHEHQLSPAKITGSSAGALVGSCLASGRPATEIRDLLLSITPDSCWDPGWGPGLLKGELFKSMLRDFTAIEEFEECSIPVHLSAYHARSRTTRVLSTGNLAEAVHASCAVPLLMQPARIANQLYWDGGIGDRHGLAATQPGERIFYHHIASRSPWRLPSSHALKVPARHNLQALVIRGLPRSSPRNMSRGPLALTMAREATLRALDTPVGDGVFDRQA
ncbi:patatin-like phospholipase family protein [Aestuariirhabdus sp. LZHN29]|uniref:patatin-like phospholipase family protein n=1 Tax=Aestuariirhabdus sp. LZHN29 TaxID=3417462 RepID=UPI003CF23162